MDPSAGVDGYGISSPPPGFDPRTVQPVASRYTDWAIPAHNGVLCYVSTFGDRNSSVGVATRLRALQLMHRVSIPDRVKRLSSCPKCRDRLWRPLWLIFSGCRRLFGKATDVSSSPLTSLVSTSRMNGAIPVLPHIPSWRERGQLCRSVVYFALLCQILVLCAIFEGTVSRAIPWNLGLCKMFSIESIRTELNSVTRFDCSPLQHKA
jgi:hypothetical protein